MNASSLNVPLAESLIAFLDKKSPGGTVWVAFHRGCGSGHYFVDRADAFGMAFDHLAAGDEIFTYSSRELGGNDGSIIMSPVSLRPQGVGVVNGGDWRGFLEASTCDWFLLAEVPNAEVPRCLKLTG